MPVELEDTALSFVANRRHSISSNGNIMEVEAERMLSMPDSIMSVDVQQHIAAYEATLISKVSLTCDFFFKQRKN